MQQRHSLYWPVEGIHVALIGRSYEQGAKIFATETTISRSFIRQFDDLNGATVMPIEYKEVAGSMAGNDDLTRRVETEAVGH